MPPTSCGTARKPKLIPPYIYSLRRVDMLCRADTMELLF
jgi:hypothetical protein